MQKEFNYKNVKKVGLVSRPNSNLDTEIANLESILKKKALSFCSLEKARKVSICQVLSLMDFLK